MVWLFTLGDCLIVGVVCILGIGLWFIVCALIWLDLFWVLVVYGLLMRFGLCLVCVSMWAFGV